MARERAGHAGSTTRFAERSFSNGVRTGRLFTNLASAECCAGSGTYCDFKVNDAEVYYLWETGPNSGTSSPP